jgi:hypothetical protein
MEVDVFRVPEWQQGVAKEAGRNSGLFYFHSPILAAAVRYIG